MVIDFVPYGAVMDVTPHACIVKGDSKYLSIAAASVLAKTYRDDIMKMLHEDFRLRFEQKYGLPNEISQGCDCGTWCYLTSQNDFQNDLVLSFSTLP